MNRKDGPLRSSVDWRPYKHVETVQRPWEQRTKDFIYEVLPVIDFNEYSQSYFRIVFQCSQPNVTCFINTYTTNLTYINRNLLHIRPLSKYQQLIIVNFSKSSFYVFAIFLHQLPKMTAIKTGGYVYYVIHVIGKRF